MTIETLSFIIAICAVLLQVIEIWRGQQNTRLGYFYTSERKKTSTLPTDIQNKFQMVEDSKDQQWIYRIKARIKNTGKVLIQPSEYERPISVHFDSADNPFAVEVLRTYPGNLRPNVRLKEQSVKIKPLLLNQGDWFEFNVWLKSWSGKVTVDTRIAGVITPYNLYTGRDNIDRIAPFALIAVFLYFVPQLPITLRTPLLCIGLPIVLIYDFYGIVSLVLFVGSILKQTPSWLQKFRER